MPPVKAEQYFSVLRGQLLNLPGYPLIDPETAAATPGAHSVTDQDS